MKIDHTMKALKSQKSARIAFPKMERRGLRSTAPHDGQLGAVRLTL
jgi:hypothetical protein